jgi:hypothetical protein
MATAGVKTLRRLPILLGALLLLSCDRLHPDESSNEPAVRTWPSQTIIPYGNYAIRTWFKAKCDQEQLRYEFSIDPTEYPPASDTLLVYPFKIERPADNSYVVLRSDVPPAYYKFKPEVSDHIALQRAAMLEAVSLVKTFYTALVDRDDLQIYEIAIPSSSLRKNSPDEELNALSYSFTGADKCTTRLFAHVANWKMRWRIVGS